MPTYIRKISRAKWQKGYEEGSIPSDANADAITGCTRTSDNTLSLWKVDNEGQIDEAILALSTSFQRLDGIDVLLIDDTDIDATFVIEQTEGNTPVNDLKDKHYDVKELKHSSLGNIAEIIIKQLNSDKAIKKTRNQVKVIINTAISSGRLSVGNLHPDLAGEL